AALLAACLLAWHQPEEGADAGRFEALPVAELHRERERGQGRDAAQATEPCDHVRIGRRRGDLRDCPIEPIAARFPSEYAAVALVEADRERPLEAQAGKPAVMLARPRRSLPEQLVPQEQFREPVPDPHQIR